MCCFPRTEPCSHTAASAHWCCHLRTIGSLVPCRWMQIRRCGCQHTSLREGHLLWASLCLFSHSCSLSCPVSAALFPSISPSSVVMVSSLTLSPIALSPAPEDVLTGRVSLIKNLLPLDIQLGSLQEYLAFAPGCPSASGPAALLKAETCTSASGVTSANKGLQVDRYQRARTRRLPGLPRLHQQRACGYQEL